MVVRRIGVVADEVPARHERTVEIGVVRVDACVDDSDDDLARALRHVPRLGKAGDAQAVLLRPVGVVGARVKGFGDRLLGCAPDDG